VHHDQVGGRPAVPRRRVQQVVLVTEVPTERRVKHDGRTQREVVPAHPQQVSYSSGINVDK
jgi:hypothetical protein